MLNTHGTRAGNCGPLGADLPQYKRPLSADGTHTTVPRCLRGKNGGVLQFQKIKKGQVVNAAKEKKNRQNPSQNPQAVTAAKTKCSSVDLPGQIKEKYALFTKLSPELRPHPLWRHYRMSDGRMPMTDRQPSCHSQDLANHGSGLRPITNPPPFPKIWIRGSIPNPETNNTLPTAANYEWLRASIRTLHTVHMHPEEIAFILKAALLP